MKHTFLAALIAATAVLGFAGTAHASDCKNVSTNLVDRPDSAVGGGTWALDTMTRRTHICQTAPGVYTAQVRDSGTFVTLDLDHTPGGAAQALPAGIAGTVKGGFTASFTAAADWETFDPTTLDGATIEGADNPSGTWVSSMFSDFAGSALNDDWSWVYKTWCGDAVNEKWTNQTAALGGNSGDITGLECPTEEPSQTPSETATATPTPTVTASAAPSQAPSATATPVRLASDTLPNTGGGGTVILALVAAGLVSAGAASIIGARWFERRH